MIELHNFKNSSKLPQEMALSNSSSCMRGCYLDCKSSAVLNQQQQHILLIQNQQSNTLIKTEPPKIFGEEHVYEEIEDEKYLQYQQQRHQQTMIPVYISSCDKVEFVNETHLNTLNNALMDKTKRVRFQGSNDLNGCTSCQNTFLLHSSNLVQNQNQVHYTNNSNSSDHHTSLNNNSILKKSLANNSQSPILITNMNKQHLTQYSARHANGTNNEIKSSSTPSSASSSSSFSAYNNNSSINSNFSLTSSHSYLFNQMVENFLHSVQEKNSTPSKPSSLKSASSSKSNDIAKKLNNSDLVINSSAQSLNEKTLGSIFQRNLQLSPSSNVSSDCSKSTTSGSNSSVNLLTSSPNTTKTITSNIDDRLSFRVTNLTLEDLKRRQKDIYLTSSTSVSLPVNQSVSSLSSSAPIQV